MKKSIFLFPLLFLILFPWVVNAEVMDCSEASYACVTCTYEYSSYFNYDVTYVVEATGKGTAEIKNTIQSNSPLYGNEFTSNIKAGDFINDNQDGLECPSIMAKESFKGDELSVTLGKNFKTDSSSNLITLDPFMDDSNDLEFVNPNRDNTDLSCDIESNDPSLPSVHVTITDKKVSYSINSKRYTLDTSLMKKDDLEIFAKGCNVNLYMECDNDVDKCFISDVQFLGYQSTVGMDETSDEIEKDKHTSGDPTFEPNPLCGKNGELCDIRLSNVCYVPTVARTLQFLGFLLFIAKILVPAIIIIMGFVNLFKIITSSKPEDAPKYAKNIVMRVVIGIIIFLIPTLANFIFGVVNDALGNNTSNSYENCTNCILDTNKCKVLNNN